MARAAEKKALPPTGTRLLCEGRQGSLMLGEGKDLSGSCVHIHGEL